MKHARALALVFSLATTVPGIADACGGCFAPPQTVQVVTDHRMVLSLSASQTTLWDQFQYTGRPQDFSWILPIRYTERLRFELASDAFMNLVDNLTAPQIQQPTPPCARNFAPSATAGGAAENDSSARDAGVMVLREAVVGPYEMRVIRGTNPMAMRDWLRANGYTVPPVIEPIIDYYTGMNADYIAVKLRPGEGISRMTPVRIVMEGYQPSLPLRMIAAGVAEKVGLKLFVVNTGRVEAMNFPNGELRDTDFTWDWANPGNPVNDYLNAFNRLNRANGGRLWMTESAQRFDRASLVNIARNLGESDGPVAADAGADAGAAPTAADDVELAFAGLGDRAMITRLRADMEGRMLDRDLFLSASDRAERPRLYQYGNVVNAASAAACRGGLPGTSTGTGPGTAGGGGSGSSASGGSTAAGGIRCATTPGLGAGTPSLLGLAVVATALARLRRRG